MPTLVIPSTPVRHDPVIIEDRVQGAYARLPVFTAVCRCRKPPFMGLTRRTVEEAHADLRDNGHTDASA